MANANDDSLPNSGAVYVFRRMGSSWIQEAYLKASNPDTGETFGDSFGHSVALWGDTLIVGAPNEDSGATGVDGDQSDDSAEEHHGKKAALLAKTRIRTMIAPTALAPCTCFAVRERLGHKMLTSRHRTPMRGIDSAPA